MIVFGKKCKFIFVIILLLVGSHLRGEGLSLSATGNYFVSSDKNYKDYYGSGNVFPSVKLTINLTKGVYLWGGYGYLSAKGETKGLKLKLKSTEHILDFGVGIKLHISTLVSFFIDGGGSLVSYSEDSFGSTKSGSGFGYVGNVGIRVYISKSLFIVLSGGYSGVETTINNVDLKLGGIRAGGGLGVSF